MRRREFITLVGAATAWPLAPRAQQPAMPVIGYLSSASRDSYAHILAAFRQGLNEVGYIEGQNVTIEYRWAEGHYDRLPAMAADLVRHQVKVISTSGGAPSARAARAATDTIPVVFVTGGDPIKLGLVSSFNRPEGNATGVSQFASLLVPKRLELAREVIPGVSTIAILINPNNPNAETELKDSATAARAIGLQVQSFNTRTPADIDKVFATFSQHRPGAIVVTADALFAPRREHVVALVARHAIPAIYPWPEFVKMGGLMSYGTSQTDAARQAGVYTGRILKGTKPSELPIIQPTKFELVINLKTAKTLGLTVPPSLLARADEVIE